jgi:replication-associated recombination protein RarA
MKAGAKSNRISIDDVRILQERLHETHVGSYRCCLIRSIERMEDPPANALLKILEEPPSGVVFLLTTESLSSILPTLVSRSRIIRFTPLSSAEMQPILEGISTEERNFFLHVAQGAPGLVKRLRDDPDALRRERLFHAQAAAFWRTKTLLERLKILSVLSESEGEAHSLVLHLALTLREAETLNPAHEHALRELARGLETNVQRPLLAQQFALATFSPAASAR